MTVTVRQATACSRRSISSLSRATLFLLQAGDLYRGSFVLPAKSGNSYITIRSAAPDGSPLPGASVRMTPQYVAQLLVGAGPLGWDAWCSLTAPGAHHYRLQFLKSANARRYGDIVELGEGSPQNTLAVVPHDLVVDRCYIHGDRG